MSEKTLYIDNRERSGLEDLIKKHADKEKIKWEVKQNLITDYCYGQLGIEAKTIQDYFQSLQSGHLQHQLENMDDNFNRMVLVIHGTVDKYVGLMRKRGNKTPFPRVQAQFMLGLMWILISQLCTLQHHLKQQDGLLRDVLRMALLVAHPHIAL